MLTSLLTAYIASTINPELEFAEPVNASNHQEVVSTASFGFDKINKKLQAPTKIPTNIAPVINARSSIAVDLKSGVVLYEKNSNKRLPIASITKLMTALIILEENQLDETVTISHNANITGGSTMHLRSGETISLENVLKGTLINSANDGAIALAEHNAGNVADFVAKMNKRASELGLNNTHFTNPTGLDHPDNYSSAADIAKLANYLYNNKIIQEIAQIQTTSVSSTDGSYVHQLESTNELLDSYLHVKGLKTGKTDGAGECFVAIAANNPGEEIITVVLNSPSRFQESKILIDWIYRSYNW